MLHAAPLEQGEGKVGGLTVGERLVLELLLGIEILVVGAGDERRAGGELQDETASEAEGAREVVPRREEHAAAGGGGVDGGLNGRSVLDFPVAPRSVVANAPDGLAPAGSRPGGDPREPKETGSSQE